MSDAGNPDIGFIGAGALGKGLALALAARGYPVAAVSSRSMSSARDLADRIAAGSHNRYCDALASPQEVADRCRLVFITTPDGVHRTGGIPGGVGQPSWGCPLQRLRVPGHPGTRRRVRGRHRFLPSLPDLCLHGHPGAGRRQTGRHYLLGGGPGLAPGLPGEDRGASGRQGDLPET